MEQRFYSMTYRDDVDTSLPSAANAALAAARAGSNNSFFFSKPKEKKSGEV